MCVWVWQRSRDRVQMKDLIECPKVCSCVPRDWTQRRREGSESQGESKCPSVLQKSGPSPPPPPLHHHHHHYYYTSSDYSFPIIKFRNCECLCTHCNLFPRWLKWSLWSWTWSPTRTVATTMWHCLTVERGITHGGLGNSAEIGHQGENIEQKCRGTVGPHFKVKHIWLSTS